MSSERFWQRSFWLGRIDARVLALFRIALGALLLIDLADRIPDLFTFYSDAGILPRAMLLDGMVRTWRFSLFDAIGNPVLIALTYAVGAAAVLAMMLGYRTRLATFVTWLFVLSLHERNLVVLDSGDTVIRILCFWMLFADSGAVWSLDVKWGRRAAELLVPVAPLRVMQLQVAVIYLCAALLKNGSTWQNGTAVYHAMQLSDWVRPLGKWLLAYPFACELMTRGTLFVEAGFIVLAFSPIVSQVMRALAIAMVLGLHAGIFLTMRVGLFSLIMPVTMLLFVRPEWIGRLFGPVAAEAPPLPSERSAWLRLSPVLVFVIAVWTQLVPVGTGRVRVALSAPIELVGLWQNWAMFAPDPLHEDGHWQIDGVDTEGKPVDLLASVAEGMAADDNFLFRRWVKYRSELFAGRHQGAFRPYASYLCRAYNERRKSGQLVTFDLVYYRRATRDPGGKPEAWQRDVRWEQKCGAETLDAAPLRRDERTPPVAIKLQTTVDGGARD